MKALFSVEFKAGRRMNKMQKRKEDIREEESENWKKPEKSLPPILSFSENRNLEARSGIPIVTWLPDSQNTFSAFFSNASGIGSNGEHGSSCSKGTI